MIWVIYHIVVITLFATAMLSIPIPWYFYILSMFVALFLINMDVGKIQQGKVSIFLPVYLIQNVSVIWLGINKLVDFTSVIQWLGFIVIFCAIFQILLNMGIIKG